MPTTRSVSRQLIMWLVVAAALVACTGTATTPAPAATAGPATQPPPVTEAGEPAPQPTAAEPVVEDSRYGGTAVIALSSDPGDLNPWVTTDDFPTTIAVNWASKLVKYNDDWSIAPDLAESWSASDDGLTYTFLLRENAVWHDGEPVTAADVKFSMDWFRENGALASAFAPIESVAAPDDHTVVVTLSEPNAPLLSNLAFSASMILPSHLYEGTDVATNPYNKEPIGSGPFEFVEWVPNDHITLDANPDYFLGRPFLDRIVFRFIPDQQTAVAAFDAGEVDALAYGASLTLRDVPLYEDRANVIVESEPNWQRILLNTKNEYLSNVGVRQAIAHALDIAKINDTVFAGIPTVAVNINPIPPSLAWAYTDDVASFAYDPEQAEAMLDEAGYPRAADGTRFSLEAYYASLGPEYDEWFLLMQEMLGDVGITVNLNPVDGTTWSDSVIDGRNFDITHMGGTLTDPDRLKVYYGCEGSKNAMGYCDPAAEELLQEAGRLPEPQERAELYYQYSNLLAEAVVSIPVSEWTLVAAWQPDFQGDFGEWYWYDLSRMYRTEG